MAFGKQNISRLCVFNAVEQAPQNPKRTRHRAARRTGMNAVPQNRNLHRDLRDAAQTARGPEAIPGANAQVEDGEYGRRADAGSHGLKVVWQIPRAAFFVRLDEAGDARGSARAVEKDSDGREGRVEAVAVVRAAPSVKFSVAHDGGERSQSLGPALRFGLLVEVAVEKGGTPVMVFGRNVKEERGRLSRQGQNFKDTFREKLLPIELLPGAPALTDRFVPNRGRKSGSWTGYE